MIGFVNKPGNLYLKIWQRQFVIDGEAVVLGMPSDFNAPDSRKHDNEVQLYAFDIFAMGGDNLRDLPPHLRKTNLERLLARRPDSITVALFERAEIGPDLFWVKVNYRPASGDVARDGCAGLSLGTHKWSDPEFAGLNRH